MASSIPAPPARSPPPKRRQMQPERKDVAIHGAKPAIRPSNRARLALPPPHSRRRTYSGISGIRRSATPSPPVSSSPFAVARAAPISNDSRGGSIFYNPADVVALRDQILAGTNPGTGG